MGNLSMPADRGKMFGDVPFRDDENDSDPPPVPSGRDPRRVTARELRALGDLGAIIDRQNAILRQERAASEERQATRRDEQREQREQLTKLIDKFSDIQGKLTVDIADMARADTRLRALELKVDELASANERLKGALNLIKFLIPASAVVASGLTWLLTHGR